MKYTVHTPSPRHFATLEKAQEFASSYFERTGNVVAITIKQSKKG
jgi:hypothetical protein